MQTGTDNAGTAVKLSGDELTLRSGGRHARAAFRDDVFDAALNELMGHPDWDRFRRSIAFYEWPQEGQDKVGHELSKVGLGWKKVVRTRWGTGYDCPCHFQSVTSDNTVACCTQAASLCGGNTRCPHLQGVPPACDRSSQHTTWQAERDAAAPITISHATSFHSSLHQN